MTAAESDALRRADRRLRAAGGGRGRRGRGAARPARPADRGEHVAGDPPRARRAAARPRGAGSIEEFPAAEALDRLQAPGRAPTSCCPSSTARSASGALIDAGRHARPRCTRTCVRETQSTYSRGARAMSDEPEFTEEELRQLEAEMERITVDDVLIQTTVTLLNLAARKAGLARAARARRRRPTGSRSARRSRAPARWCRCSRRGTPSSSARCATRSRACRWSTRSTPAARRAAAAPAGARRAGRRGRARRAARRRGRSEPPRARAEPGARRSAPAAAAGSRGAVDDATGSALPPAPDRLPARCGGGPSPAAVFRVARPSSSREVPLSEFLSRPRRRRRAGLRAGRRRVRPGHEPRAARAVARQRGHARPVGGDPGGCLGLPAPPVHDDRDRRRRPLRRPDPAAEHRGGDRLPDRRPRLGRPPASSG